MARKENKNSKRYNALKEFGGSKYSGMKVGASHKWNYDRGEWRERKVTPDEWEVYYETTKRRAAQAPEGSGAPVGTEYNWLIVAHQRVEKQDANSYLTCLDGKKFKIAHKRAGKEEWNTTEKSQRKRVIRFLEQVIAELKDADETTEVPFTVGERTRIYGLNHRTRKELYDMAVEHDIVNRSKMSREDLLEAIKSTLQGQENTLPTRGPAPQELGNKSREELYKLAGQQQIRGRSAMRKEELVRALGTRRRSKEKV